MNKNKHRKIASIFDYTLLRHGDIVEKKKAPDWKKQSIAERSFLCVTWLCIKNLLSVEQCKAIVAELKKRNFKK